MRKLRDTFNWFINMRLMNKLLLSYLLLIILPLGALSFLLYNYAAERTADQITFSAKQSFEQAYSYLSYRLDNVRESSDAFTKNSTVISVMKRTNQHADVLQDYQDMNTLESFLMSFLDQNNISQIRLYVQSGHLYSNENTYLFNIDNIQNAVWYNLLKQSGETFLWAGSSYLEPNDPSGNDLLSLTKIILNPDDYSTDIGAARFDFSKNSIIQILNRANTLTDSLSYIQNSRGDIIAASNPSLLKNIGIDISFISHTADSENDWTQYNSNGKNNLIGCSLLDGTDWYMVTVIPMGDILTEAKSIRNVILFLLLVICTISCILAYVISYSITRRISFLAEKMKVSNDGKLETIDLPDRSDEIGTLIHNYNKMTKKIGELIEQQYLSGQELKNAELRTLQAQINPHFLYNTLDLINWYAWENKGQEIIQVVESLSEFYKLSLSKGNNVVSLRDEIAHVSRYFEIQNIRYKNCMDFHVFIEEGLHQYSILKITLQPLVENCIFHGILCKESKSGAITISGELLDESIILKVEDNGIGMKKNELDKVLSENITRGKEHGFGIRNINNRLKISYGEKYGLKYESEYGQGTTVTIEIPAIKYSGFEF